MTRRHPDEPPSTRNAPGHGETGSAGDHRAPPPAVRRVGGRWQFDPLLQIAVTCTVMLFAARLVGVNIPGPALRQQVLMFSDLLRIAAITATYARIYLAMWRRSAHRQSRMLTVAVSLMPVLLLPSMLPGLAGLAAAILAPAVLLVTALKHQQQQRPPRSRLAGLHEPGE